jgi:Na+/proline symporter
MQILLASSMSAPILLTIIIGYFLVLLGISHWANSKDKGNDLANSSTPLDESNTKLDEKKSANQSFFQSNKTTPWYLIAFGSVGGSLSGVTFVSVPGAVGAGGANQQFAYWQIVLGYVVGYIIIAKVLLPIYYKYNLTSIYTYLNTRFGNSTYTIGASFFILSRSIGTAFRLFLTSMVLHTFVFAAFGLPFWVAVLTILVLIYIYTYKGGVQTIIWTDAIQTIFMLASVFLAVYLICNSLNVNILDFWALIESKNLGQIFFFEAGWNDPNNFFKQFLAGIFIAIAMTGLDQDMMQKNLSCRSLPEAQKNLYAFSVAVLIMNFVFLILGALLKIYADELGLELKADRLFPTIALEHFPLIGGAMFIVGLTAAAYASTDSALTALTTSFCVDILKANKDTEHQFSTRRRQLVHIGFAGFVFVQILAFWYIDNQSIINSLLTISGYTYGPLLGLFAFGIFTERTAQDKYIPYICVISPVLTYLVNIYSEQLFWGYKFSFELLLLNGMLTFAGLYLISNRGKNIA